MKLFVFTHDGGTAVVIRARSKKEAFKKLAEAMSTKTGGTWSTNPADYQEDVESSMSWSMYSGREVIEG